MAKFENASNYYRAGKIDEAIKECNKLSKLKNNRKLAYTWLGYLYIQKEMYDKAITYYEKAVEIDPNDQELLYSCALAYYRSGNIKMAKNYWEKIGLNYVEMPGNELHFRITSPNIENVALLKSKYLIKEVS
jgi:tetratricopeptide (TPR) repeat protein